MSSGGESSSVNDIWNSMKSMESNIQEEYRERAKTTHQSSVTAAMELLTQKQKAKAKTKKPKKKDVALLKPISSTKASSPDAECRAGAAMAEEEAVVREVCTPLAATVCNIIQ